MHSGLAAFLYIKIKFLDRTIPGSLTEQAQWWADEYHEGGGMAEDFVAMSQNMASSQTCTKNFA